MKVLFGTAAALLLVVFAAGCGETPKYGLTDGEWVMTSWTTDAGEEMVVTQNCPTMLFGSGSELTGNAGCNNFSGRYELDGDKITINLGAMNMRMCMDMTVEDRVLRQMPNVVSFEIDGNQLLLFNKEKKELFRFDNAVALMENTYE